MEIIAHRGASHEAPENTLAAARLAWEQRADALECDVHLTRDGRLAVVHDDDLRRLAGSPLRVADATLDELREHDVGSWKEAQFSDERIPELDELLRRVPAGKRLFVELKGGAALVPELVRGLSRTRFDPAQLVVISFQLDAARAAKRALPTAESCWVLEREETGRTPEVGAILHSARGAGLDGIDLDYTWPVDAALCRQVHGAGLKLYVWTVDNAATAARLARDGVDGITTNRPGWLRTQLELQRTIGGR